MKYFDDTFDIDLRRIAVALEVLGAAPKFKERHLQHTNERLRIRKLPPFKDVIDARRRLCDLAQAESLLRKVFPQLALGSGFGGPAKRKGNRISPNLAVVLLLLCWLAVQVASVFFLLSGGLSETMAPVAVGAWTMIGVALCAIALRKGGEGTGLLWPPLPRS
jgi:hypothetical protein